MSLFSTILRLLGFPDSPKKGEKTFNANETTFGNNLLITGDTIQQSNSYTLKESVKCGNLWMLKNPFDLKPIIPNIIGSFGTILGWSGVYVTGITQTLGTKITNGADVKVGAIDVSYSTLKQITTKLASFIVPKRTSVTPKDSCVAAKGNLAGRWTLNGILISTEPDQTSDIRLKKNIERFVNGLSLILKLKPVRFDWREDKCPSSFLQEFREPDDEYGYPGKIKRQYGLIAQEVEEIAPDLIGERKMYDETYKLIRYEKLVPILISAVQDQQKQIEDLQTQIDQLKEQNK